MGGGEISFRISIDPDVESASPDSVIRSESAKNDFFSKPRLHSLYAKNRMFLKCSCGKIICCLGSAPKDNIGFQGVGLKLVAKESKNVNILYL